jgi:uncharacterized protein
MSHSALERIDHRPWKLPSTPWIWRQTWRDLLFAHWPVDAGRLRPYVPSPLRVQEFGGTSWVGVVPFRMTGVMRRPLPDLPWISAFPELNVRLYVEYDGKPGVWFISLDATNRLAVWAAKRWFHLPYYQALMRIADSPSGIDYRSRRGATGPVFEAAYGPNSAAFESKARTLEHWLTERYCLYARDRDGAIWRTDVHHTPWPLQAAHARIDANTYLSGQGLSIGGPPAHLLFARRLDVIVWSPTLVHSGAAGSPA